MDTERRGRRTTIGAVVAVVLVVAFAALGGRAWVRESVPLPVVAGVVIALGLFAAGQTALQSRRSVERDRQQERDSPLWASRLLARLPTGTYRVVIVVGGIAMVALGVVALVVE